MSNREASDDRVSRRITASTSATPNQQGESEAPFPNDGKEQPHADDSSQAAEQVEENLEALDEAMAQHADELLEGSFESVEEVLSRAEAAEAAEGPAGNEQASSTDGMVKQAPEQSDHSSRAADVVDPESSGVESTATGAEHPESDETPAAMEMIPSRDSSVDEVSEASLQASSDQAGEHVDDAQSDAEAIAGKQSVDVDEQDESLQQPGEADNSDPGFVDHSGADPGLESDETVDASSPVAVSDDSNLQRTDSQPAEPLEQSVQATDGDEPLADVPGQLSKQEGESSRTAKGLHIRRAFQVVLTGVIGVLTLANAPLQLLPPTARSIVDWLALSLIFWVPVVWVLVLLMS